MRRSSFGYRTAHRQAGAALVVGLLLLLVLTVLAISSVNTSSLNLIMAGNTQYSQNAFEAAESGNERAIAAFELNPDRNLAPEEQTTATATTISRLQLCGMPQPPLAGTGSSYRNSSTYHFEIESTGTSRRGASATNVQAVAIVAPPASSVGPLETCGGGGGGTQVLN